MNSRAQFVVSAGAFASVGIMRYQAGAAEFSYKLGLNFPLSYAPGGRSNEAAQRIGTESGGRLEIKVFPANALGGSLELLSQVRLGAIEFTLPPDVDKANIVAVGGMTALPFIVQDNKQGVNILSGRFGDYVRNALSKVGVFEFPSSWAAGFLQVQNSARPINVPGDLRGLKFRTTNSPVEVALFRALGAIPTNLSAGEIYTGLQTHLVDGCTLPTTACPPFKIQEVTKYFSYTNHIWGGFTMLANAAAWQKLPKDLQGIVERNFEIARNANNADVESGETAADTFLRARMTMNNVDAKAFRKAVSDTGLYAQWKASYPAEAWALLQRSVGGTIG